MLMSWYALEAVKSNAEGQDIEHVDQHGSNRVHRLLFLCFKRLVHKLDTQVELELVSKFLDCHVGLRHVAQVDVLNNLVCLW